MSSTNIAKTIFVLAVVAIATAAAVWLAGFLFFLFAKTNPIGKTDIGTWWAYWQAYKGDPAIGKRLMIAALAAFGLIYGIIIAAIIGAMRETRTLYGTARFANASEIARAGLLGDKGIIVGQWKKRFLMFGGMQFVLLAAPTRSGKGVGIVIPNLLNWPESVVVLDVKQENFMLTSGFRARYGQDCYLFNPFATNGKTHRYNPLGYISDDPRLRVTEILAIGYALYPGEGKDSFFDEAARNLFLGLTLYLCETPELPRTIGELLRQSSGKGQPVKEYIQGIINARNYYAVEVTNDDGETETVLKPITQWDGEGLPPLSIECVGALERFTATSDNTLSSIMASFNVPLTLWASPIFDAATSANDFDLRDVRKRRMSIYLGIPANKLAEAELVLNLFFTQLINLNTDELLYARPELKYSCLLLMDEFSAPGRIGIIDKANAYMAGYGLRLLTIIQSPGQIEAEPRKGYGRESARTLITNHACQILYTPREQRDANEYSDMLGYYTFKAKGRSRQLVGRAGASESESDQKRPLMLPQELKEMSQREQIVNLENTKPIKCTKINYYSDPVFMNRLKEVSPTLRALGRKLPDKATLEAVWGSGELAAAVPLIDFDLHKAIVEARTREATPADVANGVDLDRIAMDTSRLAVLASEEGITPEQAASYVDEFFGALSTGWTGADDVDETGSSARPSADELAALDAEAAADTGLPEGGEVAPVGDEPVGDEPETAPEEAAAPPAGAEVDEIDISQMYDDFPQFDDTPPELLPEHFGDEPEIEEIKPPVLDLSVLDRPSSRP